MGYNIAICDDDNLMAQNIKNSMLHEFSNKGWQDVTIDYYEDGVRLLSSIEADNSYRVGFIGYQYGAYGRISDCRADSKK